jgi:hypothetical protein
MFGSVRKGPKEDLLPDDALRVVRPVLDHGREIVDVLDLPDARAPIVRVSTKAGQLHSGEP